MAITYEIFGVDGAPMDQKTALATAMIYIADGAQAQVIPVDGGFKVRITRADQDPTPGPTPAPAAPPAAPGRIPATSQRAKQAFDILTAGPWSAVQACGIVANIEAESNFDIGAIGDGGTAYGLCQWHSDRQNNFRGKFGRDIQASTFDEQVRFITFEMTAGGEIAAGKHLQAVTTPDEAGQVVSRFYERPDDNSGSVSRHRGDRAVAWAKILIVA